MKIIQKDKIEARKLAEAWRIKNEAYRWNWPQKTLSARAEYLISFGIALEAKADKNWIENNLMDD